VPLHKQGCNKGLSNVSFSKHILHCSTGVGGGVGGSDDGIKSSMVSSVSSVLVSSVSVLSINSNIIIYIKFLKNFLKVYIWVLV
jgi:hypothetical protein